MSNAPMIMPDGTRLYPVGAFGKFLGIDETATTKLLRQMAVPTLKIKGRCFYMGLTLSLALSALLEMGSSGLKFMTEGEAPEPQVIPPELLSPANRLRLQQMCKRIFGEFRHQKRDMIAHHLRQSKKEIDRLLEEYKLRPVEEKTDEEEKGLDKPVGCDVNPERAREILSSLTDMKELAAVMLACDFTFTEMVESLISVWRDEKRTWSDRLAALKELQRISTNALRANGHLKKDSRPLEEPEQELGETEVREVAPAEIPEFKDEGHHHRAPEGKNHGQEESCQESGDEESLGSP